MVVAAHVETNNWITAGTLWPRWEHTSRIAGGPQKQTGQNIKEISTESSHTLM